MNEHSIEHRLDQAIDALNNEASPAPYEQGDRELFNLVDTARLAKSLRDPAEPDANFPQLAIDRITADLRQSAPGNGIPPAATPTIGGPPMTTPDNTNPRGPIPFFRRHAQLAAIIAVLLLVGGGLLIYQSLGPDDDGSPAVGVPDEDDAVVADATPTASDPDEDVDPVPAVTELRIDGALCCGAVHGEVGGDDYIFLLTMTGSIQVVHVNGAGSLELVSSLEPPFSITPTTLAAHSRIAFADGMIYAPLPGDDTSGLWIVDVTDPANPVELALIETEMPPLSVAASNGVAAVAPMSFTGPLYVFDVSDPANTELVGEHEYSVASMPPTMEFDESLLFLTDRSGVIVIDLADPENPNDIGSFPNPDWEGPSTSGQTSTGMLDDSGFRDATLMDEHLVIAAANAGIRIIDISDPSNLHEVSQLDFDIPAFRVAATDTELYVLDTSIGSPGAAPISEPIRIHTVDVSDIANPTISQSTLSPDGGLVQWLLPVNDNLYLLDYGIIRMFEGDVGDADTEAPIVHFPQFAPGAISEGMDADLSGEVVLENGCIRVRAEIGDEHPLLIWPEGFALQDVDGNVEVVNAEGDVVARVGEPINLWGGFWAAGNLESLEEMLTSPLPDACSGPYWAMNPQTRPLDENPESSTNDVEGIIERFQEVQQEVEFDIVVPVELAGFPAAGISVVTSGPPDAPSVMATVIDNSSQPPRMFSLNQRPGGFGADPDRSDHEAENVTIQRVETTLYTRTTPGQDGTELDIHQARWEMNGITYDLASTNIDRDSFLAIAESITPLSEVEEE